MKNIRKIASLILALVMVCTLATTAFAAEPNEVPDVVPTAGTGTITVNNAGIGETYKIYKVLDAEVGANGAIIYTGDIPEDLEDYFVANGSGEISVKADVAEGDLFDALKTWAEDQNATDTTIATTSTVVFDELDFGYYVVTSTMNGGAVVSVTSTTPNAVTYEKNVTTPQPTKKADDVDYSIGDTITYTVTFNGANYMQVDATGANAKIVTSYTVSDTLPNFLTGAKVKSITIGEGDDAEELENIDFNNKSFNIPWAEYDEETEEWTSLYPNGTLVTIVYTATLTDVVRVGEDNTNTVTITPNVATGDDDGEEPWDESWHDDAVITTYATAIKKVDEDGKPLAGAKFKIQGLTVTETDDGVYTVVSYDAATTLADSTEMEVNADGMLYIVGLKDALSLSLTETAAPTGYNILTAPVTITSQLQTTETFKVDGYRQYDAKGNIISESVTTSTGATQVIKNLDDLDETAIAVQNNKGAKLPETGGMGTTMFYILGGILVAAAVVLLVTKKRMASAE